VLRIVVKETNAETRWILQGNLFGPWVCELRSCWKKRRRTRPGHRYVVELNDVTCIDESGERLLRAISKMGAQLVANGLYTKHRLEMIISKAKPD
jgi:hypothetical protein